MYGESARISALLSAIAVHRRPPATLGPILSRHFFEGGAAARIIDGARALVSSTDPPQTPSPEPGGGAGAPPSHGFVRMLERRILPQLERAFALAPRP